MFKEDISFSILSLFSGGGLLDLGFMHQGFQIEQAFEINDRFIEGYNYALGSYSKNTKNSFFTKGLVSHRTINKPLDVSDKKNQKEIKKSFKGIAGVIGGPPCQDFSVGGKNRGVEGERGKLLLSYLKTIQNIKPKFLFFENVEGLYKTRKHKQEFLLLCSSLESLGYVIWYDIINPLSYGFPQDRPRLIVVGFRKGIVRRLKAAGYNLTHDNNLLRTSEKDNFVFRWPKTIFENVKETVHWPITWNFMSECNKEEIERIPKEYEILQVRSAFKDLTDDTPNQLDRFTPKSNKFYEVSEGDTFRKSFKRLHRFRYSPTVAYGNNEVHLHPTEARRISVREALRLQTVPDEYILPSTLPLSAKFKLISNGVPSRQAELIASEIRKTLLRYMYITGDTI